MNLHKNLPAALLGILVFELMPMAFANAQQVSVTAADPPSAVQGTVSLDVTVTGSGFNSTASVKFLVTGTTDTGGITVKKVIVSGSKKLIATIDVADTAVVNKFDIEVALSNGRKGKGTTLFAVQAKETGKPQPPPVPPPPPGSCTGAPGVFPAFAYTKDRSHVTKRRYRTYDGTDLYLANSTGSCSVLLSTEGGGMSYRQIGNEARIAWPDGSRIMLLKLTIDNGNVMPVAPSIVYTMNYVPASIGGVDLSPDGQTIYFPDELETVDGRWIATVKSIDIGTCTTNCPAQTLYTFPDDNGVGGVEVNASDDRLYMSIHNRPPNIRTISFLEKQGSTWSSPLLRHVVSNQDAAYASVSGFANTAVGRWDHNNSSVLSDVVSIVVERSSGDAIDIIDVSNCSASGVSSCLSTGESSVVRSGIAGNAASFTTTPASTDPAPNLLVSEGNWRDFNESVTEIDLDSMAVTPLVEGLNPDSAD